MSEISRRKCTYNKYTVTKMNRKVKDVPSVVGSSEGGR
jgi:hypothetical protein